MKEYNTNPMGHYRTKVYCMNCAELGDEIKRIKTVLGQTYIGARDEARWIKEKSKAMLELSILREHLRRQI